MVTQNHFVIPATVLEKFRSRGFPEGVTLNADHCRVTALWLQLMISCLQKLVLKHLRHPVKQSTKLLWTKLRRTRYIHHILPPVVISDSVRIIFATYYITNYRCSRVVLSSLINEKVFNIHETHAEIGDVYKSLARLTSKLCTLYRPEGSENRRWHYSLDGRFFRQILIKLPDLDRRSYRGYRLLWLPRHNSQGVSSHNAIRAFLGKLGMLQIIWYLI